MALPIRRLLLLAGALLCVLPAAAHAATPAGGLEAGSGGSGADGPGGGTEYGSRLTTAPGRPRVVSMRLASARVVVGTPAQLVLRLDRPQAQSVRVRVITSPAKGRTIVSKAMRVKTGTAATLDLPARLKRGTWRVRVVLYGATGETPVRSKSVTLIVKAKPKQQPTLPAGAPTDPVPVELGGRAYTLERNGAFPVLGTSWSFGEDGARFGAGRIGHIHEGQDIPAPSGTPVVAPLAGEILFNDFQASAAGRYVVLHADNGWDMFFAHCIEGSAKVQPGQRVAAGARLCLVGSTGSSSGPHLHFEIWPDGWRQIKGTTPVDPLPQLKAWAGL
ncbi:MAG: peptidoglycan DD-metalloendopeptidase family protein [Actinobacteria bacterium]|nr:peptidoglycan DD-metalloendopeptidase family protein [Actinomycetota bacterium]